MPQLRNFLISPEGQPILPDLDYESLALTVVGHRAANRQAYIDRYNYRLFLMTSGMINRWRKEGHRSV